MRSETDRLSRRNSDQANWRHALTGDFYTDKHAGKSKKIIRVAVFGWLEILSLVKLETKKAWIDKHNARIFLKEMAGT